MQLCKSRFTRKSFVVFKSSKPMRTVWIGQHEIHTADWCRIATSMSDSMDTVAMLQAALDNSCLRSYCQIGGVSHSKSQILCCMQTHKTKYTAHPLGRYDLISLEQTMYGKFAGHRAYERNNEEQCNPGSRSPRRVGGRHQSQFQHHNCKHVCYWGAV